MITRSLTLVGVMVFGGQVTTGCAPMTAEGRAADDRLREHLDRVDAAIATLEQHQGTHPNDTSARELLDEFRTIRELVQAQKNSLPLQEGAGAAGFALGLAADVLGLLGLGAAAYAARRSGTALEAIHGPSRAAGQVATLERSLVLLEARLAAMSSKAK